MVSHIRKAYEWSVANGHTHKADVIQTQTPINPGNSGGPLLDDQGRLIGVNSFKAKGEGLNFAITVDEVRRFLASARDGVHSKSAGAQGQGSCTPRELKRGRRADGKADRAVYDLNCDGTASAILTIPDNRDEPITLGVDSRGRGTIDVVYVDTDRDGRWDVSLYDTDGDGKPDLIGHHRDGGWEPYRVEKYVARRSHNHH